MAENHIVGNLLNIKNGILVHGCNNRGAMGAGIAKDIVELYPDVLFDYKNFINNNRNTLGRVVWTEINPFLLIASGITQPYYGREANKVYVNYELILSIFREVAFKSKITTLDVFYPRIGAGLGGGNWNIIYNIIKKELVGINHTLVTQPPLTYHTEH
jgi:O-acetyl-ADP-ribose deacetylase (regulator of RNase III)